MTLLIGAGIGAVACYALHNGGGSAPSKSNYARSYVAFGHDLARGEYNTSQVWDFRDRLSFNDNLLYNKLPHIDLKPTTDWNPNNLDFSQAYGPPDMDSPRPRLEHFLDSEIRAW